MLLVSKIAYADLDLRPLVKSSRFGLFDGWSLWVPRHILVFDLGHGFLAARNDSLQTALTGLSHDLFVGYALPDDVSHR
jgi:hypothetical protein